MSTDDIFCETIKGGYNSSIVIFQSGFASILYETLVKYYDYLLKYLMRFDHYLEMLIWNADFV
jgi:hypothetical protein